MKIEGIVDNKKIIVEIEKIANNSRSVIVESEGTKILCVLDIGGTTQQKLLPLFVNVIERSGAINKIPSGYKKRELLNDFAVVMAKLIDRSIRPLIDINFSKEMTFYVHIISYKFAAIEPLAVLAASIIFHSVGLIKDVVSLIKISNNNMNLSERVEHKFEFFHAISDQKTVMMDFEGLNLYSQDSVILNAYNLSMKFAEKMRDFQLLILKKMNLSLLNADLNNISLFEKVFFNSKVNEYFNLLKNNSEEVDVFKKFLDSKSYAYNILFRKKVSELLKEYIEKNDKRIDGREWESIRPLIVDVVSDNSVIASMGNTEILSSIVVDDLFNLQVVESLSGSVKQNFIAHYTIMPYCEKSFLQKQVNFVSRKEVVNSFCIRNSLAYFIQDLSKTIRVALDVISLDGSSCMISICAASVLLKKFNLIKSNISGVSIGMFIGKESIKFMSDLSLLEVNYICDVSCNVIGTSSFISVLQIDSKCLSLSNEYFLQLFSKVQEKISEITLVMNSIEGSIYMRQNKVENLKVNDLPKQNINDTQLKKRFFQVELSKIGVIIGNKGSVIKNICNKFNVKIKVFENGEVMVSSNDHECNCNAIQYMKDLLKYSNK